MQGGGVSGGTGQEGVHLRVLGPLAVRRDGAPVALGGRLPRNLLLVLASAGGRTVGVARLVDELWGDDAPGTAEGTVASYVSRLRKLLDAEGTAAADSAIQRQAGGYNLVLPPGHRDDEAFREALDAGRRALRAGELDRAVEHLDVALGWWTDELPPLEDLPSGVRPEAMRLVEERTEAVEARADALVQLGRHDEAIRALETFVRDHPLRERGGQLLALALYRSGRQVEALRALRSLVERLDEEYGLEPRPELRALEHDILTQAPALEGPAEPAVATAGGQPEPRRAPTPLTRLVGRDELYDHVLDRLNENRLVTLVGPGGSGKTRLAAAVAQVGDAAWAALAETREPDLVDAALVAALGAAPQAGVPERQQLVAAARQGPPWLVVDNAEHVAAAVAASASAVIAGSEGTNVLVTSRAPLGIPGEVVVDVDPLATDAGPGDESPAASLFLERALEAAPGWEPDAHDRIVADELCRRLDGLPLAVELAAARVRDLAPEEILAGLASGPALLSGGSSSTPHHASLASAMAWSYDVLDDDDRAAMRALAAFDGSFDLASAAAILGRSAVDNVRRLVGCSLLIADLSSRPRRYRMLQVVREWTRGLTDPPEAALHRTAMARWASSLARSVAAELRTPDAGPALRRLDADMANIRRALRDALDHQTGDPLLALQTIIDLKPYWQRSQPEEGVALLRRAIELERATGETDSAIIADALLVLLRLSWAAGDYSPGHRAALEAADVARAVDRPFVEAVAMAGVAVMTIGAGDLESSTAMAETAVAQARALPGRDGAEALGNALLSLAITKEAADQLPDALDLLGAAADAAAAAQEWMLVLAVAYYHGRVAFRTGNHERTVEVARPAARLAVDIGVDGALVQHARALGGALAAIGQIDEGSRLVGAANAHAARLGSEVGYADATFARDLEAFVDPALVAEGATWGRSELVAAVT